MVLTKTLALLLVMAALAAQKPNTLVQAIKLQSDLESENQFNFGGLADKAKAAVKKV